MKISQIFTKTEKTLSFEDLFLTCSFAVIIISWIGLLLTILGIFYKLLVLLSASVVFGIIFFFLRQYKKIQKPSKSELTAFVFILAFVIFSTFFAHETFEGGRDQGIYANSAVYLSKNHTLKITEKVQSPGFILSPDKRTFITNFHFGYISWLALHHAFLGIAGIKLANFLPLIISLFSLFLIGKKIANTKTGFFTVLMMSTSFIVIWYSRRTLSEIYFMALIWFGILTFLKSYLENKAEFLMIATASFGLLLFTRAEGVMIFGMFLGLTAFLYLFAKKWRQRIISVAVLTIVVLLLFVFYFLKIQPSYNNLIVSTLKKPFNLISGISKTLGPAEKFSQSFDYIIDRPTLYILQVLWAYNLLISLGLALITVFWAFLRIRRDKKNILFLIIFALIFPTFFELINITTYHDQPWMLRRFLPTIIPFAYLFSSVFLVRFIKAARYLLLFLILGVNLIISAPILTFVEFENILQSEVKEIAQAIPNDANVFYERQSSGRFNIDLPLHFIFGKENIAFKDASEIIEFINQSGPNPTYAIFHATGHTNSLLPEGSTELIMEKIIRYKELERIGVQQFPSEFITRHTFYGKTPRKINNISIPLKIVKIKEDFKKSLPDNVLLYSQKDWSFTKDGFLLKRGNNGNIRYKGTKPQKLQLTYNGERPEVFALVEGEKEKLENAIYHDNSLIINLDQIDLSKWYGYYSFDVFSKNSDLLIKEIFIE